MTEPLGSPKLDDPTAQLEKAVNTAFDRLENIVVDVMPQVANRPFDSQKIPRKQQLLEYDSIPRGEARVQAHGQRLAENISQEGAQRGLQMFIEYVEDMERGS